jgi:hypothetical protein
VCPIYGGLFKYKSTVCVPYTVDSLSIRVQCVSHIRWTKSTVCVPYAVDSLSIRVQRVPYAVDSLSIRVQRVSHIRWTL